MCEKCEEDFDEIDERDDRTDEMFDKDIAEENLEIAHELGACGGDCPHCQQEGQEQRDERGDPDYPREELDVP